jgi:hypothetical protein
VEHIFGVAKLKWKVLAQGSRMNIRMQARLVQAIAVLLIHLHDPDSIFDIDNEQVPPEIEGNLAAAEGVSQAESRHASAKRDEIAQVLSG